MTTKNPRYLTGGLAALFALSSLAMAQGQPNLNVRPAPPSVALSFDVATGTLQDLQVPADASQAFDLHVSLNGEIQVLQLRPFDVRSSTFQLLVDDGNRVQQVATPQSTTMRGEVRDDPASRVAASIHGGRLSATILLDNDPGIWGIQPTSVPGEYIVYHSDQNLNHGHQCGVSHGPMSVPTSVPAVDIIMEAEIACEADYRFYQRNGSNVTNTQNDVTSVINSVSLIYERDVDIRYLITTILVRTSAGADPYSSTNSGTLLGQFRSHWNSSQGSVVRDLAHLFTGRSIDGNVIGIAYLGVVCNRSSAYGLVESRFTSNYTARVALSAHEIGHNWNAGHCNQYSNCRIMCASLGGCGPISSFGPTAQSQIGSFRNSRNCLTPWVTVPRINSLFPITARAFQPQQVTLTGSGFDGTTSVQVGTLNVGPSGFQVVSDTQIQLTPPVPTALGATPITVTNPAGTSNSVNLTYTDTRPPILDVGATGVGGFPLHFNFGAAASEHWYLVMGLSPATSVIQGSDVLSNFAVFSAGTLDPAGIGTFSTIVPAGVLTGITVHSQILNINPSTLLLTGASNVGSTTIYF